MMTGNETTRRRRVQGRASGTAEASSTSRTGRLSTASSQHQQPLHQHHHDHHHHHYHYHHHYHHFPRSFNGDQEQSLLAASGISASTESDPSLAVRGLRENFLEEFSLLFEEDEDAWSDDELLEFGIQEWLAAVGFGEGMHPDVISSSEQGLSKAFIRRLQKEVFVPEGSRVNGEASSGVRDGSDQEDCSVCLEHFLAGQQLIRLPCKHRFHPGCLTPWLESHAKCPYCRAKVSFDGTSTSSSSHSSGRGLSLIEDDLIAWMEAVDSGLSQLSIR